MSFISTFPSFTRLIATGSMLILVLLATRTIGCFNTPLNLSQLALVISRVKILVSPFLISELLSPFRLMFHSEKNCFPAASSLLLSNAIRFSPFDAV